MKLQCVAVCCSSDRRAQHKVAVSCSVLQFVAVRTGELSMELQCVAVCCSELRSVLQCVAVRAGELNTELQCIAVCCSVLYCVAVRAEKFNTELHVNLASAPAFLFKGFLI